MVSPELRPVIQTATEIKPSESIVGQAVGLYIERFQEVWGDEHHNAVELTEYFQKRAESGWFLWIEDKQGDLIGYITGLFDQATEIVQMLVDDIQIASDYQCSGDEVATIADGLAASRDTWVPALNDQAFIVEELVVAKEYENQKLGVVLVGEILRLAISAGAMEVACYTLAQSEHYIYGVSPVVKIATRYGGQELTTVGQPPKEYVLHHAPTTRILQAMQDMQQ